MKYIILIFLVVLVTGCTTSATEQRRSCNYALHSCRLLDEMEAEINCIIDISECFWFT